MYAAVQPYRRVAGSAPQWVGDAPCIDAERRRLDGRRHCTMGGSRTVTRWQTAGRTAEDGDTMAERWPAVRGGGRELYAPCLKQREQNKQKRYTDTGW